MRLVRDRLARMNSQTESKCDFFVMGVLTLMNTLLRKQGKGCNWLRIIARRLTPRNWKRYLMNLRCAKANKDLMYAILTTMLYNIW